LTPWFGRTRVRLALAYSGIFSAVTLVAAVALTLAIARIEYSSVDDSLSAQARSLEPTVAAGNSLPGSNGIGAPETAGGPVSFVFEGTGQLVDSVGQGPSPDALLRLVRQVIESGRATFATIDVNGVPERVRADPVALRTGGARVLIVVGSRAAADQVVVTAATVLVLGMLVLVVAATVLGYGLAGTALRPVREIVAAARALGERDLHRRIELDLPRDELGELADTFNAMLSRLEIAFDSLRRFTADAAHELRAPLALIRTEAEVTLSRPRSADEYTASLGTVLAEAQRMSRLADQLLMLARAEAGALVPQVQPVDLRALVQETVRLWQPVAAEREVVLVDTAMEGGAVRGDHDLLRRLLDNLIDNALRYSPKGSRVVVDCRMVEAAWELTVADEGPGVPVSAQASIFERFSRADQSRARETGGAGLGLALCSAIAELHQGSITLDATAPTGARFVVRLPLPGNRRGLADPGPVAARR
jgi:heavy metal sensor kinase